MGIGVIIIYSRLNFLQPNRPTCVDYIDWHKIEAKNTCFFYVTLRNYLHKVVFQ